MMRRRWRATGFIGCAGRVRKGIIPNRFPGCSARWIMLKGIGCGVVGFVVTVAIVMALAGPTHWATKFVVAVGAAAILIVIAGMLGAGKRFWG
jgi:hypothetical protein